MSEKLQHVLKMNADAMTSTGIAYVNDEIKRIAELEQELKASDRQVEILTDTTSNMNDTIAELEQDLAASEELFRNTDDGLAELEQQNLELQANNARLREAAQYCVTHFCNASMEEMNAVLKETPAQSLATIQADAVERASKAVAFHDAGELMDYAKALRNKEGE